jgi:hypothetical protein
MRLSFTFMKKFTMSFRVKREKEHIWSFFDTWLWYFWIRVVERGQLGADRHSFGGEMKGIESDKKGGNMLLWLFESIVGFNHFLSKKEHLWFLEV